MSVHLHRQSRPRPAPPPIQPPADYRRQSWLKRWWQMLAFGAVSGAALVLLGFAVGSALKVW